MTRTARTLFITGAAAGIGRATTLTFLRRGWTVGGYDLDEAGLATLAAQAAGLPGTLVTGALDVTDGDRFAAVVTEFTAAQGRLDVLVNNAGLLVAGPFEEGALSAYDTEVDVNVKGVLHGAHAAYGPLRATAAAHGTATLVNLCSASAIYGQAELANYSATKFYVRGLTEALDLEWGRHGIRVVALWPLFVQTGMLSGVSTGTTTSLGVRLQAQDVADALVEAVEPSAPRRAVHQVHFPVGRQAQTLALGARFSPGWLTRVVNKRLAAH